MNASVCTSKSVVQGCILQVFQFFCGAGIPQSCVFVSEFELVCGSDDGQLTVLDTRHTR